MQKEETQTIHQVMSALLETNLKVAQQEHDLKTLNAHACTVIYQTIFETVVKIVTEVKLELSNEGVNYIAQQYYDGTLINNQYELDPNIFDKRAKLEEIETTELLKVAAFLRGTDFLVPVVKEIKRRQ